jgi:iron-sulfur cluster repair protein YtfE (RIC family)
MMTLHELLTAEHGRLRQQIADIQKALQTRNPALESAYAAFQKDARAHFRKEDEVYYPHVDQGKKLGDRELMHSLRNDHAAVVFALESLAIRLRKQVPMDEWKAKFDTMIKVLLIHFEQEEQKLFPTVERLLPPAELQDLLTKTQALE